jgi:long-chain acyl-CoA synthetase
VRPGDIVVGLLTTRRDTVRALLAVSAASGVLAPVNRWLAPGAFRALLAYVRPDWVIADGGAASLLARNVSVLPARNRWIDVSETGDGSWASLERGVGPAELPDLPPDEVCYIDFTSGSLGAPKGVPRTHGSIWSISESAIEGLGLRSDDRHLSLFAPFAHPHEALARAAVLGGTLVCVETLRPSAIATTIARHSVTCVMGVPTVYGLLARRIEDPRFSTLRLLESGGAITPEALVAAFRSRLGIPLTPVWGCTEAGGIALAGPPSGSRPEGAVGMLCPGFDARLVPHPEAEGSEGELLLRGPSLAREYFRLPSESARAFRDGWYHSGDVFDRDAHGAFYFRGRTDEMIKVKGLKVFPTEIEQVLLRHPEVAEAAVVAGSDPGDSPVAFIMAKPGASLTEPRLRAFCREHLPPFKVPQIMLRRALPKTRSGKILKRGLHGLREE